jgi:hypothetical protein
MQRINHHVFKHPEDLMANIAAVIAHLRRKIIAAGGNPDRETLTLVPQRTERLSIGSMEDSNGERIYILRMRILIKFQRALIMFITQDAPLETSNNSLVIFPSTNYTKPSLISTTRQSVLKLSSVLWRRINTIVTKM